MALSRVRESGKPIDAVADEYLVYACDGKGLSQATVSSCRSDYRLFLRFLRAQRRSTDIELIARMDIRAFTVESQCTASTKQRRFHALSSLFRYAVEQGYIADSPVHGDDRPKAPRRARKPIPPDDLAQVVMSLHASLERAVLGVLIYAGLRASEVVNLRTEDVRVGSDAEPHLLVRGKGGRERRVPIAPQLEPLLSDYASRASPADRRRFFAPGGEPLTYKRLRALVRRCLRRAGIAPGRYTLHQVRHTFGTQLVQCTDIRTAQAIMGHADINTTAGYCHSDEATQRAALSRLPAYDRMSTKANTAARADRTELVSLD